jgi:F-type H+-transporting ATPase subunit beta
MLNQTHATPQVRASGTVVSVRGSVVDIRFEEELPPIFTLLHAGADNEITIEVSRSD